MSSASCGAAGTTCMSAVAEINLLLGGWECLLEPVISWTITYCFCLIKGLTWPRRGTTDIYPTPSCADESENKCHICNCLTVNCAGSFMAGSKVLGQCDTRHYYTGFRADGEMVMSTSKSLLSFLSGLESTTTP